MSCLATTANTRLSQWWVYLFLERKRNVVLFTIFTTNLLQTPPLRQARERYKLASRKSCGGRNSR